jgi:hypothetical protein
MRKLYEDSETTSPPLADPREVEGTRVGTPVRDAAVDPQPGDFLAPVNAGTANPHGEEVANPEIHASGDFAVLPGDVADVDTQQQRESELASRILVGDEPVPEVTQEMATGAYDSKVDAADPAAEANTVGQAEALATAPATAPEKPARSGSTGEWRAYAISQGLPEDEANSLSRDELRDRY